MEKAKLSFDKVILARTVSADLGDINVHNYDMLVFYSPSEITSLVSACNDINSSPKIATFGHGTVKAAIEAGLTVSVMAPTPEVPSMTKAIDLYIKKVATGENVEPVTLTESPETEYIKKQEAKPVKKTKSASTVADKSKPAVKKTAAKSV